MAAGAAFRHRSPVWHLRGARVAPGRRALRMSV